MTEWKEYLKWGECNLDLDCRIEVYGCEWKWIFCLKKCVVDVDDGTKCEWNCGGNFFFFFVINFIIKFYYYILLLYFIYLDFYTFLIIGLVV
jgi:hypothetical protein